MQPKFTILLCTYTGEVGLVRKEQMHKPKVLLCTGRKPPTYKQITIRDTLTLGWVIAPTIDSAFQKIPHTFLELTNGNKHI